MKQLGKAHETRGATGSGYALTVGLISIVALGAVTGAGGAVTGLFGGVGDTLIEVAEANLSITPGSASGMNITSGPVPATSSPVVFAVKNIGNSPMAALNVSLTNETDFVINADGCAGLQLQSQSTCTVSVSMTAVSNGSFSGSLRVGGGAKFVEAPLSGTASGLDPASLSVDQPSVTGMDVAGPGSPATGTPVTLTFTNDGEITTGSLSTSNDNATNFAISSDTCNGNTLAGGATCSMQVTPQASDGSGSMSATVSVGDGSVSASSSLSGTITGFQLFTFTSHVFTNCGQTGATGPSLAQCRSAYSTSWDENSSYFNMTTNGIQRWTVPETGTYRITAVGAQGAGGSIGDCSSCGASASGGRGASMRGDFNLTEGDVIQILVGQMGKGWGGPHGNENGGGGGSFVVTSGNSPMIIAGGGGGGHSNNGHGTACSRSISTANATTSQTSNSVSCYYGVSGVSNGAGGTQSSTNGGGAGGGFSGNGAQGPGHCYSAGGGNRFTSGGNGGLTTSCYIGGSYGSNDPDGGFGGGGAGALGSPGAGGGYSGGVNASNWSSYSTYGGGAGSYNNGTNQSNSGGANTGHGSVTIQKL